MSDTYFLPDEAWEGRVAMVRGKDGTPPYVVRWFDTGSLLMLPMLVAGEVIGSLVERIA